MAPTKKGRKTREDSMTEILSAQLAEWISKNGGSELGALLNKGAIGAFLREKGLVEGMNAVSIVAQARFGGDETKRGVIRGAFEGLGETLKDTSDFPDDRNAQRTWAEGKVTMAFEKLRGLFAGGGGESQERPFLEALAKLDEPDQEAIRDALVLIRSEIGKISNNAERDKATSEFLAAYGTVRLSVESLRGIVSAGANAASRAELLKERFRPQKSVTDKAEAELIKMGRRLATAVASPQARSVVKRVEDYSGNREATADLLREAMREPAKAPPTAPTKTSKIAGWFHDPKRFWNH